MLLSAIIRFLGRRFFYLDPYFTENEQYGLPIIVADGNDLYRLNNEGIKFTSSDISKFQGERSYEQHIQTR